VPVKGHVESFRFTQRAKRAFGSAISQKYGQNDPAARFRAAGEIWLAHFARGFGVRGGRHLK
jgi:hypothetical protein